MVLDHEPGIRRREAGKTGHCPGEEGGIVGQPRIAQQLGVALPLQADQKIGAQGGDLPGVTGTPGRDQAPKVSTDVTGAL